MNLLRMNDLNIMLPAAHATAKFAFVVGLPVMRLLVSVTLRVCTKSFQMIRASPLLAFELPEVLGIHVLPSRELALYIAIQARGHIP